MNDTSAILKERYAQALGDYLAQPQEAGLMRAYDLGRRALALDVPVAEVALIHGQALATALAGAESGEERARQTQRAAEFLGETMAPFEMMLRGYKEANTLLQRLNETLEQRVKDRTAELKESEERYRDLFENAGDLILGATPDGKLLYVNRAWREHLGHDVDAALRLWDVVHPDHRDAFRELCRRAVGGETVERAESVFLARDGRQIIVEGTLNCRQVEGRPVAVRGIFRDITERKRMEQALREADRRKDEFLATLAHELRNPLAPIRNALEIISLADPGGEEDRLARGMLDRQVQHLVRLVDDLLDVSRITRGKIELRRQRLDLAAVVRDALEISRPHIEAARQQLTVSLPPTPVLVHADSARLAQVVANLLNNATKYTEAGGRIWLTAEQESGLAVVRVRDTGVGIPPEMLDQVFDMFVQVSTSVGRSEGGMGIGLTLVKRLVEMHGGTVVAQSDGPEQGSEFVVRLPVLPAGEEAREPELAPHKDATVNGGPGLRILVVDDNRDSARSLGMLMKLAGHSVQVAHDGAGALELVRTFRPTVLFQDIDMPGMSGYEVARRLREQPALKDLLLVAVTGYGSEEDRRRCLAAGFDHHLVKPVDLGILQRLLANLGPPR